MYITFGLQPPQWAMSDNTMVNKNYGPQYIESLPNTVAPTMIDPENKDTIMQADTIFQMGATDMRTFMFSQGDGVTV